MTETEIAPLQLSSEDQKRRRQHISAYRSTHKRAAWELCISRLRRSIGPTQTCCDLYGRFSVSDGGGGGAAGLPSFARAEYASDTSHWKSKYGLAADNAGRLIASRLQSESMSGAD